MAGAGYTFLPWCRRGIVAEVDTPDTGQALALRAAVKVGVTITNASSGGVDVTLLGPGDVTGIDPRLVVRIEPRPGTTAFEPNHLAGIDFDLPDLPWLLTPARPTADVLRPWLALVVVEQQAGVTVGLEPGALLPVLRIEGSADAAAELPDPVSTPLWAHGQLLADAAIAPADLPAELEAHPDRNVSRLLCPRRLRAGARCYACVVPTFNAGVVRGLGRHTRPRRTDGAGVGRGDRPAAGLLPLGVLHRARGRLRDAGGPPPPPSELGLAGTGAHARRRGPARRGRAARGRPRRGGRHGRRPARPLGRRPPPGGGRPAPPRRPARRGPTPAPARPPAGRRPSPSARPSTAPGMSTATSSPTTARSGSPN